MTSHLKCRHGWIWLSISYATIIMSSATWSTKFTGRFPAHYTNRPLPVFWAARKLKTSPSSLSSWSRRCRGTINSWLGTISLPVQPSPTLILCCGRYWITFDCLNRAFLTEWTTWTHIWRDSVRYRKLLRTWTRKCSTNSHATIEWPSGVGYRTTMPMICPVGTVHWKTKIKRIRGVFVSKIYLHFQKANTASVVVLLTVQ